MPAAAGEASGHKGCGTWSGISAFCCCSAQGRALAALLRTDTLNTQGRGRGLWLPLHQFRPFFAIVRVIGKTGSVLGRRLMGLQGASVNHD